MKLLKYEPMKSIVKYALLFLLFGSCATQIPVSLLPNYISGLSAEFDYVEEENASFVFEMPGLLSVDEFFSFYRGGGSPVILGDTAVAGKKVKLNGDYTYAWKTASHSARFVNGRITRIIKTDEGGEMKFQDLSHVYDENPYYIDYNVNSKRKTMSSYTVHYIDASGNYKSFSTTDWMAIYKEVDMYGKKRKFYYQVLFWPEVDEHINYLNSIR